jgi:hypothetical protein
VPIAASSIQSRVVGDCVTVLLLNTTEKLKHRQAFMNLVFRGMKRFAHSNAAENSEKLNQVDFSVVEPA